MSLYSSAVKRPVTTALVFVAIAILGLFSLTNLSIDLYPKIEIKNVMVVASYPGAGGEDIENNVARPLENSLNSISQLKHIKSSSKDNFVVITMEFEEDADLDAASNDIRDKLDAVKGILPKEVSSPLIFKFSSDDIPVMLISVQAKQSAVGLNKIIEDKVTNRLARVNGIGSVNFAGASPREIQVYCDQYKLEAYNIPISTIAQAIAAANKNVPIGSIDIGSKTNSIRVQGELSSSDDLRNIVIGNFQGKNVYLYDVARVDDSIKEKYQQSYANGISGGIVMLYKQSGANSVSVSNKIKEELPDIQASLPSDVNLQVVMDTSTNITNTINSLMETIIITFIVVILVVLFFLGRWRATFIIILTIPISLVASFIYLYATGNTLNIVSMSALSIAIGMVVDDAIVVLENITTHIEKGSFPKQASIFATNEVAISVVASTLTMLAVFLPLTLVQGMTGIMFRQLGFIVSIVLIVSTVAALTLTPMMSSNLLRRTPRDSKAYTKIFSAINRFLDKISAIYAKTIGYTVRHRTLTIVVSFLVFLGSVMMIPLLKTEFFPEADQGLVTATIQFAPATNPETVKEFTSKYTNSLRERFKDDIKIINYNVGAPEDDNARSAMFSAGGSGANLWFTMTPYESRKLSSLELTEIIRKELSQFPEIVESQVTNGMGNSFGGNGVDLEVYGYDFLNTSYLAKTFAEKMRATGVASQVTISRKADVPEYRLIFDDEKLAMYGLTKTTAATQVRSAVNGIVASYFRQDGDEYDIRVRYSPEFRKELRSIMEIMIMTPMGTGIRVQDLGRVEEVSMPPSIERKDRERYVSVSCMPAKGYALSDLVETSNRIMKEIGDVEGTSWKLAGAFENQQKSFQDLFLLMALIIILVYIVMAAQFESLMDPFVIMFSVPFGFTGVILGLYLTNTPLGIMALIGAIMLIGIVVKNGIVLIDYTRLCRERGMGLIRSVITAGESRLRPVLMTTATTVLGMIPLAIGIGEGSEMWQSMGMTVATGLAFSTLVTLVLIPTIYTIVGGYKIKRQRRKELKGRKESRIIKTGQA